MKIEYGKCEMARPILFNGQMVRAILDGKKTQTRRVIKPHPKRLDVEYNGSPLLILNKLCSPHGKKGDLLWVQETFASTAQAGEDEQIVYRATDADWSDFKGWKWKPSIFMPRWASRITLKITNVRVERVQNIAESDAQAEGASLLSKDRSDVMATFSNYRTAYYHLWNRINAKRGYGWETNPWVWVLEFEREKA